MGSKCNKQTNNNNKRNLIDTDDKMVVTRKEGGGRRMKRVKGVKYKVTEGDLASGSKHTIEYTDVIS